MALAVHVPKPIRERIKQACSRQVFVQVYTNLHVELAQNPERYRHNLVPSYGRLFRFSFEVHDDQDLSHRHIITFNIQDESEQGRFVVYRFKRSRRAL